MTEEIFRDDPYRAETGAMVVSCDASGIVLDRTVFYPRGGGQAGDAGSLRCPDGLTIWITDTVKAKLDPGPSPSQAPGMTVTPAEAVTPAQAGAKSSILHVPAPGQEAALATLSPGDPVTLHLDWDRRHRHMRFHTATHLLCAIVPLQTNGCSITATHARLDFDVVEGRAGRNPTSEPLEREHLERELARLVAEAHDVRTIWITDEELDAKPELVRTMSVKPPRGLGRVRLLEIEGVDLQPCGGTHVANTREIGSLRISKIEKKSARSRRVVLEFAS